MAHERRRAAHDHESRRPAPGAGALDRLHRLDDGHRGLPGLLGLHGHQGRRELGHAGARRRVRASGIRVNLVVPGYVRTPMLQPHLDANEGYEDWILERTPVGRIGGPDEVAPSILFMLSPLSQYVDGATLVADGGWIAQ